ncbi:hypothetical protein YC2023_072608 [Brassica napus]
MSSAKIEMEKFDRSIVYNMWKERLLANLDLLGLIDALTSQENEEKAVDPVLVEKQQKGESSTVTGVEFVESLMVSEANLSEGIDFKEVWILDTGCSFHMTPRKDWFVNLKESSSGSLRIANDFVSTVESVGTVIELGCTFKSENGYLEVIKESRSVLRAKRHNKLYFLQRKSCVGETNVAKAGDNTELWHRRLGHVSQKGQDIMVKKGYLDGKRVSILDCYESCIFGKFHRASYETGQHTSSQCLEYVHCDLWGSLNVHASLGKWRGDTTEEVEAVPEEKEVQDDDTELENYMLARDRGRRNLSRLRSLMIMYTWLSLQQKMEIHLNLKTMQRLYDMLVACMNMKLIKDLKQQLSTHFEIKDLGAPRSILGIDIVCDKKNGALLS